MIETQTSTYTELTSRYPGPRPFTYADRKIFWGRQQEVSELLSYLRQYNHVLLYARSGIGKSSLIEAGLLPELESKGGYWSRKFIFGAYNKKAPISPLDAVILKLQKSESQLTYLDKLVFQENSLWYQIKKVQFELSSERSLSGDEGPTEKQIVLIFDQFEELFTYPEEDITIFKEALAEMLFSQIPGNFRNALREKGDFSGLSVSEIELLHRPLNIRILFSIRSDRMALLNRLTDCIPEILKNFYEIKPLTREQCTQAIIEPAQADGEFNSPAFKYDKDLLNDILSFLSKDQEKYVESFQLQIICKYIEDLVRSKKKLIISKSDVPIFETIFFSFYEKATELVPTTAWYEKQEKSIPVPAKMKEIREATREMVEKGLIFRTGSDTGIRLNLYREQIAQQFPNVDDAALWTLSNERILRDTPDAAGRMRYELSHDTLIKPILQAMDSRERSIREQADQEERRRLDREETSRKRREIGVSGKIEFEWDYIVDQFSKGNVVLILGENALQDAEGVPLFKRFIKELQVSEKMFTYYEEEQMFAFNPNQTFFERWEVVKAMQSFYKEIDFEIPIIESISKIPIPLIVSLDPSNLLNKRLNRDRRNYNFSFYDFTGSPQEIYNDNGHNTQTIFNLNGSLDQLNSIPITHDEIYYHIYNLLGNKPLSNTVRNIIHNSGLIILYGINLQRPTNEIVLWQLLKDNERSIRLSLFDKLDLSKEELRIKALLKMDFQPVSPISFFEELRGRLMQENITVDRYKDFFERKREIEESIMNNELDIALKKMMALAYELSSNESLTYQLSNLSTKLFGLEKNYGTGISSYNSAIKARRELGSEFLKILNEIVDYYTNSR